VRFVGRLEVTLGLVWVLTVTVTYFVITGNNPLPDAIGALGRIGELSRPSAQWSRNVGDPPAAASVVGDAVIVRSRDQVEARSIGTGAELWHRAAAWSAVAGDERIAVVVVGIRHGGIEVLEPRTGAVRWRDADGVAAWTYQTAVITLTCQGSGGCALVARAPADGGQRWRTVIPGLGRGNDGVNQSIARTRNPSTRYAAAVGELPAALPALLGLSVGRRIEVIDTTNGRRAAPVTPPTSVKVAVAGGRTITTTAKDTDGACRYGIEALNPATGTAAWHRDGADPHTVTGAGCDQRRSPTGGGTVLVVTRSDGREALLSAVDGHETWVAAPGESVRAVGDRTAMVRAADGKTVRAVDSATGRQRWSQPLPARAAVTVLGAVVLVLDDETGRLMAYDQESGRRRLEARILGEVIGAGPDGLVLGRGGTIGYVRLG
jgi:outer membrane protein assembly factor BamB